MPVWKVLLIVLFGLACLALTFATIIVPMTSYAGDQRWLWLAGLLTATIIMGSLFAWFLRSSDRAFKM